jgi:hypothetical protein
LDQIMGNVLAPYSFTFQGGFPQGTDPQTYGTVEVGSRIFYVSKTGDDGNSGTSEVGAFLTINKAASVALNPGDIVNIGAGTYTETTTVASTNFSVAVMSSGTLAEPIIFQALAGDEGTVIIDSELVNIGFTVNAQDYIQIRNLKIINSYVVGVHNWNSENKYFSDATTYSKGCVVEGNYIYNTVGPGSSNNGAIRMDQAVDWVVRNNLLDRIRVTDTEPAEFQATSGIRSYHLKDCLIENNTITNSSEGITLKDHWLNGDDSAVFEAEVRHNFISTIGECYAGITGNSEPIGDTYWHNNIMISQESKPVTATSIAANNALPGGCTSLVNNTLLASTTDTNTLNVFCDTGTLDLSGNIILSGERAAIMCRGDSAGGNANHAVLTASDYNIFDDSGFTAVIGDGAVSTITANSLVAWQAVVSTDAEGISFDSPDINSVQSNTTTLFNDFAGGDYTNKVGSPAIGLMLNGDNAGAYQLGTEVIGTTGGGAY